MRDADPLHVASPYEVLGVSETGTIESIEQTKDDLLTDW